MITIKLEQGVLDVYNDEEIQWQWTAFRFAKGIIDPFTNDIAIPKTGNNMRLLDVYSLLDSKVQKLKKPITPAIMQNGSIMIPIYIQVAEVLKNDIKICLYESTFLSQFKDKQLSDFFVDDASTIVEWTSDSYELYPDKFVPYNYGVPYNKLKAQYHTSKSLDSMIQSIATQENLTISGIPSDYKLLASKKTVCPQNTIQTIQMDLQHMQGGYFLMVGGQHIVNDLSKDDIQKITFNRDAHISMKFYWIWRKKLTTTNNFNVDIRLNDQMINIIPINSSVRNKREGGSSAKQMQLDVHKGDTLSFYFPYQSKFQCVSIVVKMEYSNYNITEDDYGTTLEYYKPWLLDEYTPGYSNRPYLLYYDGDNYQAIKMTQKTISIGGDRVYLDSLAFSYFGYYCNLPDISIGQLFYDLQWMIGKKLKYDYNQIWFEDFKDGEEAEGYIESINPSSTYIGQNNYIRYKNEINSPITKIDNDWLEKENNFFESIFEYLPENTVKQYSIGDNNTGMYEYNEIENPVIFSYRTEVQSIPLYRLNMNELTQSNEVEIELINPSPLITQEDIIYIDGRKYMIIKGTKNYKDNSVKLTCLAVYSKQKIR